jgi:hypothetical protein
LAATTACDRATVGTVATGVAQLETFDFFFLKLQPVNGLYTIRTDLGSGCADRSFNRSALVDMLNTKTFEFTQVIGGGPVTVNAGFTFESMEACIANPVEVKFDTDDLSVAGVDANGNPVRTRPENIGFDLVEASLSSGGVLNVNVFEIKVIGTTTSRTAVPGPVDVSTAEIPDGQTGGGSGVFTFDNLNPTYIEAELTNVLTNPDRFTATFSFLAKKADPADPELLLVWDGDMVLRTDL